MKVAVPSNDKEFIAPHTGRAKGFLIFEINGAREIIASEFRENRKNKGAHDHHHGENGHHHPEVAHILGDCDVLLATHVGPHFEKALEEARVEFLKVKAGAVDEALKEFCYPQ